ncbi:hypothetical protein D3C75_715440 [compost metagenome]
MHVGQRNGAQRGVERAQLVVALEQLADLALAGGNDHQVAGLRVALQLRDAGILDHQFAATTLELGHPHRHLDALVHRLPRCAHQSAPVDQQLIAAACAHVHAVGGRALLVPEGDAEFTLEGQCHVVHGLAGHDAACADLFGAAVGDDADCIALAKQADAELQAGLAGSDDGDLAHASLLR